MKLNRRPESGHQDVIIIEPTNRDPDADGQGVLWGWEGLDGSFHPFHSSTPRPSPCLSYLLLQGGPPRLTIASWTGRPPCARLCPFGSGSWGTGFRLRHRSPAETSPWGRCLCACLFSRRETADSLSAQSAWASPVPEGAEPTVRPVGAPVSRFPQGEAQVSSWRSRSLVLSALPPSPVSSPPSTGFLLQSPRNRPESHLQIQSCSSGVLSPWLPRSVALSSRRDGHTLWEWRPRSGQLHKGAA